MFNSQKTSDHLNDHSPSLGESLAAKPGNAPIHEAEALSVGLFSSAAGSLDNLRLLYQGVRSSRAPRLLADQVQVAG